LLSELKSKKIILEKILITGISGYIGDHCVVELLKSRSSIKGSF
tara:strand:- start:408 stop:539 length:132 start_codon:yes stop_codon:yes gene_type:complete